jgi:hypothetical protein
MKRSTISLLKQERARLAAEEVEKDRLSRKGCVLVNRLWREVSPLLSLPRRDADSGNLVHKCSPLKDLKQRENGFEYPPDGFFVRWHPQDDAYEFEVSTCKSTGFTFEGAVEEIIKWALPKLDPAAVDAFLKEVGSKQSRKPKVKLTKPREIPQGFWVTLPECELSLGAFLDWYGEVREQAQILCYDIEDEPAVSIRYSDDGRVEEVMVRDDLIDKVVRDEDESPWMKKRDESPETN